MYTINFVLPVAQISPLLNLAKELILLLSGWKMIIQMVMIMTMMTDDNGDQEGNRKKGADLTPPRVCPVSVYTHPHTSYLSQTPQTVSV